MTQFDIKELEDSISRFAQDNSTFRQSFKKAYSRQVYLEDAIRRHSTGGCECLTEKECLARLYRLVPMSARKIGK